MPTIAERLETATATLEAVVPLFSAVADIAQNGGLIEKVAMPANSAAAGAVGQYAIDYATGELAVYAVGGWLFFQGYQK